MSDWQELVERWTSAGVIDAATAARIRDFQAQHGSAAESDAAHGTRWPVVIAIAFGCLMVSAGILLFVAAHWDELSPASRFALVIAMVAGFHVAGAFAAEKHAVLATALHGVGTASLGAGIFLAGQIFHLQEHWPGGMLLWAIGALIGWWLLRDVAQGALTAVLVPWWLAGEWQVRLVDVHHRGVVVIAAFVLMTTIVYFGAVRGRHNSALRRALMWIGGIAFLPAVIFLAISAAEGRWWWGQRPPLSATWWAIGWTIALGLPLVVAWVLRRTDALLHLASALWVGGLSWVASRRNPEDSPAFYLWLLLGAIAMIAWGVREARKERINMGVAGFAITVMGFYFSSVFDKLGRSAALISMGLIFLVGGWYLEKARRRLIARVSPAEGETV